MRNSARRTLAALLLATLAGSAAALAESVRLGQGRVRPPGTAPATGGPFRLESRIAPRQSPQGEGYVLTPPGSPESDGEAPSGAACFCGALFADDFESGDTSAWSVP